MEDSLALGISSWVVERARVGNGDYILWLFVPFAVL